jgi:hypothetical protein
LAAVAKSWPLEAVWKLDAGEVARSWGGLPRPSEPSDGLGRPPHGNFSDNRLVEVAPPPTVEISADVKTPIAREALQAVDHGAASPAESSSAVVAGACQVIQHELPSSATYEFVRRYHESETASEMALADPVRIAAISLIDSPIAVAAPRRDSRDNLRRCQFADEIIELLPGEGPAVIAITSVENIELWPTIRELCQGLTGRGMGEVLAIAQPSFTRPQIRSITPSFSEVLVGLGAWQDAVSDESRDEFAVIERGDLPSIKPSERRCVIRLWREMCERFAYVVIDAATADATAALPLLATCDATFIAVRLNETDRHDASRFIEQIRSAGGYACGCLVG